MGYYIRVLGKNTVDIPLQELREAARPGVIDEEHGKGNAWDRLLLRHKSGQEIALIEKNPVIDEELGVEELQEFVNEVSRYKPRPAAEWLQQYLPTVRVIYAFQLLSGTDVNDGWTILHHVHSTVWKFAAGILQADGEGFSNEQGFTILWQFGDSVTGSWSVGVLANDGRWVHFEIDLGNEQHRQAFLRGDVPAGAKLL